jgi:site-specific recombinase XerC
VPSIDAVQPVHVATWIEAGTRELAAPSVKQRLAAIRHLFDWLVTGQVVPVNPAGSVRGPRHVVTCGQTPVLDPAEARALLDSIDTGKVAGLRDRALIGLMVYSFARIGAAVEDVYTQNRRLWVRLREKGGKRHAMPCHHNLDEYLVAYLDGAGLRDDPKGPLFRTIGRGIGKLTRTVLPQANAYAMIRRRAAAARSIFPARSRVPVQPRTASLPLVQIFPSIVHRSRVASSEAVQRNRQAQPNSWHHRRPEMVPLWKSRMY